MGGGRQRGCQHISHVKSVKTTSRAWTWTRASQEMGDDGAVNQAINCTHQSGNTGVMEGYSAQVDELLLWAKSKALHNF